MSSPRVGFRICVSRGAIGLALGIFGRFGGVSEDPPEDYIEHEIGRGASFLFQNYRNILDLRKALRHLEPRS